MSQRKVAELAKQFELLTLKDQIGILTRNAFSSRLHLQEILDEIEKTYLQMIFQEKNFSVSRVALALNVHRNTVRDKLRKFNIKKEK